ncbi:MAG: cyclic nucleotide-binding domain-containing protein [Pseudomonadota bacterium]
MRKALYILGDLMDQDLIWLARAGELRDVEPGQLVIQEGRDLENLFIVTDGKLSVLVGGQEVAELGTGDVVGEMSFVEKQPPSADVRSKGSVRVLAVPRRALLEEFRRNDAFAARFYRALAVFLSDRLRSMMPGSDDELDEGLLDSLHVAGDRMLRLIELLEGEGAVASG